MLNDQIFQDMSNKHFRPYDFDTHDTYLLAKYGSLHEAYLYFLKIQDGLITVEEFLDTLQVIVNSDLEELSK